MDIKPKDVYRYKFTGLDGEEKTVKTYLCWMDATGKEHRLHIDGFEVGRTPRFTAIDFYGDYDEVSTFHPDEDCPRPHFRIHGECITHALNIMDSEGRHYRIPLLKDIMDHDAPYLNDGDYDQYYYLGKGSLREHKMNPQKGGIARFEGIKEVAYDPEAEADWPVLSVYEAVCSNLRTQYGYVPLTDEIFVYDY